MAAVRYKTTSLRDTKRILAYLAQNGGLASAVDFAQSLQALETRLSAFPKAYPLRKGLGIRVRAAVIRPYVVLYRHIEEDDSVTVLRVIHGHRRITASLLRRN